MTEIKTEKKSITTAIIFFALCFIFSCGISFVTRDTLIDTDAAAELVLSDSLAESNSLISREWYYSTELRVISTQLVYMPLFKITGDWGTVRFVSSVILRAILLLSYFYFGRKIKLRWEQILCSAGLMLLPLTTVHARILLIHSHYIPYAATAFVALGLFADYLQQQDRGKRAINLLVQGLVALTGSLCGIRYLQTVYIPLIVACLAILVLGKATDRLESPLNKEDRRTFLGILWGKEGRPLVISLTVTLFAGVGYICNSRFLSKIYTFKSYGETVLRTVNGDSFISLINAFLESVGYYNESGLMSAVGIMSVFMLFAFCYLIWRSVDLIKEEGVEEIYKCIVPIFFLSALFVNVCILFATRIINAHYFLPVWMYVFPLIAQLMSTVPKKKAFVKKSISLLVCLCFMLSSILTARFLVNRPKSSNMYYGGLVYRNIRHTDDLKPAVEFLQSNGYDVGFARFLNSNVIIQMTDGQIECVPVEPYGGELQVYKWGTFKKYENPSYYEGKKLFLLLNRGGIDEKDSTYLAVEPTANNDIEKFLNKYRPAVVFEDENYIIYDFD